MEDRDLQICTNSSVFQAFEENNQSFLHQPIVRAYLEDKKHYLLYVQAICQPTEANIRQLDECFRTFYFERRMVKYVSVLIYHHAREMNKRYNRHFERHLYILDKPIGMGMETSVMERIEDKRANVEASLEDQQLLSALEDPVLFAALKELSPKQREVLELVFMQEMELKAVAKLFGDSPQNISNIKRRALKNLQTKLRKGRNR
ncbi:RNA polymerase sigma factor [Shouchella shacheensis]|uniref:RNA polymerase sigma factor n=1 Tax=Shouchella shacheensis TaxID=1649580 RepID=UPI00074006D8|nr:sigma-70 family RNA polymerase sigma factor [Shouchella shacheensis]